ncbi:polysaccharide biosynthesis protein [Bacillus methanolicus]|uniref:putative polysaccharide biosynthesis protein n=1 Tax=Bacillus methanolicus TaxID=1471 RepID=UPI002010A261|nr:polysaccharide biosynthesis protein [Bacillus methanolicus]UQD50679.1 polysaccharide biosynthesis protein [Bacillus methanolicus]
MKPEIESKQVVKGAFLLTVAAIITKILSAIYRVPFQNIAGDIGFYIYQQVYPFYGAAVVLSTYGFPVVISKLYAEKMSLNDRDGANQLLVISFFFLLLLGLICFFGLYTGADWLSRLMGDSNLAPLFKVISLVFLIFPFISVLRGYFQGKNDMVPTAVSQIGEQTVRVATILTLASVFMAKDYPLYFAGAGAVFGSVTGALTSAFILWLFLKKKNKKFVFTKALRLTRSQTARMIKALSIEGTAICITGMLLIIIQLADSLNLYSLLIVSGAGREEAKVLKGIYDRGQPLIQLGTAAATSLSLTLVPLISREKLKAKKDLLLEKIKSAIQISVIIGTGASVGLWSIIEPTNKMLFENSEGSNVLAVLCFIILLSSIIITLSSILQGMGYTLFPALTILAGFALKLMGNLILVPSFGIMGAAMASLATFAFIMILLMVKVWMIIGTRLLSARLLFVVMLAAGVMALILHVYITFSDRLFFISEAGRIASAIQAVSAVGLGGLVYLWIILRGHILKKEEIALLPLGSKLLLLLPKRD